MYVLIFNLHFLKTSLTILHPIQRLYLLVYFTLRAVYGYSSWKRNNPPHRSVIINVIISFEQSHSEIN